MNMWRSVVSALLAGALVGVLGAQSFGGYQGGQGRLGQHDADKRTFNPGRPFLRWWDPLFNLTTTIDNPDLGATPLPGAAWSVPSGTSASFAFQSNLTTVPVPPAYRFATPVGAISVDQPWTPAAGTAPTFTWQFNGLIAGDDYGISVNIPVGPTDVDPSATENLAFQARYQVYRITGVENLINPGQPIYQVVDTNINVGGWVRLGNNGNSTNLVYRVAPTSTAITVTLIGTVPRLADGSLADVPADVLVLADAARIEGVTTTAGRVTTQAVVGFNGTGPFQWRTVSGRSEDTTVQDGSEVKSYGFPLITSYTFDSTLVIAGDNTGRRNMVWSWPVQRPFNATPAEQTRFGSEKADWLLGEGLFVGDPKRTDQTVYVDNTNGNVRVGAAWISDNTFAPLKGVDYLTTPAVAASASNVVYAPKLTPGRYIIEVFIPGGTNLATGATYEVQRNGVTVATDTIDQQANAGRWVRIIVGQTSRWDSDDLAPLSLVVTGTSNPAVGEVLADQVRFIKTADTAVRSTPIYTRANVRVGGTTIERDVVIVTMDNGRVYCLDARGLESAGVPTGRTQVYWVYPSETTGADPNHVAGLDGPDGMAEMPSSFFASSAAMARVDVGGSLRDLLYVGSQNGRVYCIDIEGRGDGTTTRRWSYPNDYPSASVESALGPIQGSVAFADTVNGPTVFVPTTQGRLYALNAAGNDVTKTTTERWSYPDIAGGPVGSITMTPVVGWRTGAPNNRVVYFGTNDPSLFGGGNTMFAVSADDGNGDGIGDLLWSRTAGANPWGNFLNISPAFADQSDANPNWPVPPVNQYGVDMPNTLFVGNTSQEVSALDADTGNLLWASRELGASPCGPLSFSHGRLRDVSAAAAVLPNPEPMVVVPTTDGRYVSFGAPAGRIDASGRRINWTITTSLSGNIPSMSFGGPNAPTHNYMYGADPAGYLYAWSWDPSLPDGGQAVTPGTAPIPTEPDETRDPTSEILGQIVNQAQVEFILPQDFADLQALAAAGTLTEPAVNATLNKVTRRNFEFGETAYLVIRNLPDPAFFSPPYPYTVDIFFNAPGQSSQRVAFGLTPVNGAIPFRNRIVLASFSFLGIGQNALVPGISTITVRALSVTRPGANRTIPAVNFRPGNTIFLANPLAVEMTNVIPGPGTQVGTSLSPSDADNIINGTPAAKLATLIQPFRPELSGPTDLIAHGQTGLTRVNVFDRSLMSLLFGRQRGLSGVRMQLSNLNFLGNPLKPLDPTIYPGLEDLPGSPGTNVSLDYPDIRRDRLIVTKQQFGQVENPLFQSVTLSPPNIVDTDLTDYRTNEVQYNQFLQRALTVTPFDFEMNVPKFQPPTTDRYLGSQFVFVDAGAPGRQVSGNQASEPFRQFGLSAGLAIDERPVLGTPTVDLGSISGGGGYLPSTPWATPGYNLLDNRIHNQARYPFFQRFSVFNEGNVNLLNLRVAKVVQRVNSAVLDVFTMFAPTLNAAATMDSRLHLHSDLDPFFAAISLSGRPVMGDHVILQKARPDDGEPTRLRVNPIRRANANLEVIDGSLLGVADFASAVDYDESLKDPKIAVSVPIGMPVGRYQNSVFVFEDRFTGFAPSAPYPALNIETTSTAFEPYTDSPLSLIFNVRETRLTTSNTGKSAKMADNIPLDPAGRFVWANQQPAAARAGNGAMVVAITSDRLLNSVPDINPGVRQETEAGRFPQWRIYLFSLGFGGTTPVAAINPLGDLDRWTASSASGNPAVDKWFNGASGAYPTATNTPSALFGIPNTELDLTTLQFTNPAFPHSGFSEPLSGWGGSTGKASVGAMRMAFVGEVTRRTASGDRRRESRLMLTDITLSAGGAVTAATPVALNFASAVPDPQAKIGKPSLVQSGRVSTVFYPITSAGSTEIYFSTYDGTQWVAPPASRRGNNGPVNRLNLGSGFESVNSPSASLRNDSGPALQGPAIIDLVFTGRLRGRNQPEVYMARISSNGAQPRAVDGTPWARAGGPLFDQLVYDPAAAIYWSNGADLVSDFSAANGLDIQQLIVTAGVQSYQTILVPGSNKRAEGSPVISYDTTIGGKAFIDISNGSVRFSGAMVPRASRLFLRYSPRLLRVSAAPDVNHRAAQIAFDERASSDFNFWFNPGGVPITSGTVFPNRWIVSYGKTAARDSQASRPYMMTMRTGVRLSRPIRLNTAGAIANLTVTFTDGYSPAYQVDPAAGAIYFDPGAEGRRVNVTYDAIDRDGTNLGTRTLTNLPVEVIEETPEAAIPIEQVSNESSVTLFLDAQSGNGGSFNANGRPGLIWMFWSSTRAGGSDIFFQTVAPRFSAQANGN